mmetsp:Transcript_2554/g.6463  ORF Transcript_2554/g.6463 Transcript_2554/m.6463 type:complete len:209 (-) Transcript_2554:466-1092(-)
MSAPSAAPSPRQPAPTLIAGWISDGLPPCTDGAPPTPPAAGRRPAAAAYTHLEAHAAPPCAQSKAGREGGSLSPLSLARIAQPLTLSTRSMPTRPAEPGFSAPALLTPPASSTPLPATQGKSAPASGARMPLSTPGSRRTASSAWPAPGRQMPSGLAPVLRATAAPRVRPPGSRSAMRGGSASGGALPTAATRSPPAPPRWRGPARQP